MTTFITVAERKAELCASVGVARALLANLADEAQESYAEYSTIARQDFLAAKVHLETAWRTLQYATEALSNHQHAASNN